LLRFRAGRLCAVTPVLRLFDWIMHAAGRANVTPIVPNICEEKLVIHSRIICK
jgi:hypothetical protein